MVLSVDIGGSKLIVGLVDEGGRVIAVRKSAWGELTAESVMRKVLSESHAMLLAGTPDAVGVNIPGLADPVRGVWLEACFSGIRDIPVSDILSSELGLPTFIDNDVNNCALAEHRFGACKGVSDFAWLTVSNGCGGAVFIDSRVYRGPAFSAGEFGHIRVEEEGGYSCGCGGRGCLEAQAAGPAILRMWLDTGGASALEGAPADAKSIANAARSGDALAKGIYDRAGAYIGRAVACVANALAPSKIIIGGGVSGAYDLFETAMLASYRERVYRRACEHTVIEKTALGGFAALLGAAALAAARGAPVFP